MKPVGDYTRAIGAAIATRRTALGFDQKTIADRIGLTQATLSRIECGQSACRIETLRQIALALGCRPHHIAEWAELMLGPIAAGTPAPGTDPAGSGSCTIG